MRAKTLGTSDDEPALCFARSAARPTIPYCTWMQECSVFGVLAGGCPTLAGVECQVATKTVVKPHLVYTMYKDNSGPLQ